MTVTLFVIGAASLLAGLACAHAAPRGAKAGLFVNVAVGAFLTFLLIYLVVR